MPFEASLLQYEFGASAYSGNSSLYYIKAKELALFAGLQQITSYENGWKEIFCDHWPSRTLWPPFLTTRACVVDIRSHWSFRFVVVILANQRCSVFSRMYIVMQMMRFNCYIEECRKANWFLEGSYWTSTNTSQEPTLEPACSERPTYVKRSVGAASITSDKKKLIIKGY